MLIKDIKYSYNDIAIIPAIKSDIEHRSECNVITNRGDGDTLPIFTAPMDTVVNEENFSLFEENGIIPILPRNFSIDIRKKYIANGKWVALSLNEFKELFIDNTWDIYQYPKPHVLIDIANGHMSIMHNMIKETKQKYGKENIIIMCGNVANPKTYYEMSKCGVDYVRFSVGSGFGCLTTSNVGVNYPLASLISETYEIKKELEERGENTPYIIADGGCRNYSDIIKALAIGSDFVMVGSLFARLIESAADTFYIDTDGKSHKEVNPFTEDVIHLTDSNDFMITTNNGTLKFTVSNLKKVFYGMASKQGQLALNGKKTKTSEGCLKVIDVTTNIDKWVDNMEAYLKSAMSYTNCREIDDFNPQNVDCIIMSNQAQASVNK